MLVSKENKTALMSDLLVKVSDSLTFLQDERAFPLADEAISISKKNKYNEELGRAYLIKGNAWRIAKRDYRTANKYYDSATLFLKSSKDFKSYGRNLIGKGACLQAMTGYESARGYYFEAIKVLEKGDELSNAFAREQLSYQVLWEKKIDKFKELQLDLIRFYEKKGKILRTLYTIGTLSRALIELGDTSLVRSFVQKSRQLSQKFKLSRFEGESFMLEGDLMRAIGKYSLAIESLQRAEQVFNRNNNRFWLASVYHLLASCYIGLNDFKNGELYLKKALTQSFTSNFSGNVIAVYRELADFYQKNHRPDSAFTYLKKYAEAKDREIEANHIHLVELEKIYKANQQLTEHEELKARLMLQRKVDYGGGVILLMLILFAFFAFHSRKKISKRNKELKESNAELFSKNDEILAQNEEIISQQEQLSVAYENTKLLHEIGQVVTKGLSVEDIVGDIYQYVSKLMDASIFGIGIMKQSEQEKLEFPKVIKNGKPLPPFEVSLTESNGYDTWCIKNKKPVLINDLHYDFHQSIEGQHNQLHESDARSSLICAPIIQDDEVIGLMYAQSVKANMFTEYHLNLVQNICIYTSNALVNAKNHQTIVEKNEMLDRHNAVKDKLFSVISHDLRGPMNSLKGLLPLVKSKTLSEQERDLLVNRVEENFKHTQQLLDNVLQWANAKISGVAIMRGTFDLQTVTNQTISVLQEIFKLKEITVETRVTSVKAYGDENTIQIVIRNLISNAIKFTPRNGKITVSTEPLDGFVKVNIADTGVGIPEEFRKNLFQIKVRHTTYGTEKEKGTGLGLHLCKEFVEINGGEIGVISEVGKGSCFWFTVPVNAPSSLLQERLTGKATT